MQSIEEALSRLSRSKFRSGFRLSAADRAYLREKGMDTMRRHAQDFVRIRLSPADPANDGKQTPMSGHPVFKAMHATACCCRGCLSKWYRVPMHRPLTQVQQDRIVDLLMAWIERQTESAPAGESHGEDTENSRQL